MKLKLKAFYEQKLSVILIDVKLIEVKKDEG